MKAVAKSLLQQCRVATAFGGGNVAVGWNTNLLFVRGRPRVRPRRPQPPCRRCLASLPVEPSSPPLPSPPPPYQPAIPSPTKSKLPAATTPTTAATPASVSYAPLWTFWEEGQPAAAVFTRLGRDWTTEDWEHAKRIYRLGRTVFNENRHVQVNDLEKGFLLLDHMAEQRLRKEGGDDPVTAVDTHATPVIDDPWLIQTWSQFFLQLWHEEKEALPNALSYTVMAQRVNRYLATGILAWNPQICTWVVQTVEKKEARTALLITRDLTKNYSNERPVDKFLVNRLLKILGKTKADPERAAALVEHLRNLSALDPDNDNLRVDAWVYTAWVTLWSHAKDRKLAGAKALEILKEAVQNEQVSIMLYNAVITALCRSEDQAGLMEAQIVWEELVALDLRVTAASWTPLFQEFLHRNCWREAYQLYQSVKDHQRGDVRPHHVAHKILLKNLERDMSRWREIWGERVPEQVSATVDWNWASARWDKCMEHVREAPSHSSVAKALLLLDTVSLAPFQNAPTWAVPSSDMDELITAWNQLERTAKKEMTYRISPGRMFNRLRKYQGIGLLKPGPYTLDWMMRGAELTSTSASEAAALATSLLDMAVKDCYNDVHHPAFPDKRAVIRLMRLLSKLEDAAQEVEVVYTRLLDWYEQSGQRNNLEPDDDICVAYVRALQSDAGTTADILSQRVAEFWEAREDQLKRSGGKNASVEFYYTVATVMAEAGRLYDLERLTNATMESYASRKVSFRKDLDLQTLLMLAHCRTGSQGSLNAQALLERLEDRYRVVNEPSLRPSNRCYDTLLQSLAQHGHVTAAIECVFGMVELNKADKLKHVENPRRVFPSRATWVAVLEAIEQTDSPQVGELIFQRLMKKSQTLHKQIGDTVKPDTFMYNCMLRCLAKILHSTGDKTRLDKMQKIVKRMERQEWKPNPDEETYRILLDTLVRVNLPDLAMKVLRSFIQLYLDSGDSLMHPRREHFHTVIDGLLKIGDVKSCETAIALLETMKEIASTSKWDVHPNTETFCMVIKGCRENGVGHHIMELLTDLLPSGNIKPAIYAELVSFWTSSKHSDSHHRIIELSDRVLETELAFDTDAFRLALDAYATQHKKEKVVSLVELAGYLPQHMVMSLTALMKTHQYEHAKALTDRIIDALGNEAHGLHFYQVVKACIALWKESSVEEAGRNAERLLECTFNLEEHDRHLDSSVFADVLFAYFFSQDPGMLQAVNRIFRVHKEVLGLERIDLTFIEAAVSICLKADGAKVSDSIVGLLTAIRQVDKSIWLSTGKDVSARLKKSIARSSFSSADKRHFLRCLGDAIKANRKVAVS